MNSRTIINDNWESRHEITSILHDLRNPVCAIHGCAEMLIGSKLSESQTLRIVRTLYGVSARMREMLDEFSSRESGTHQGPESCELGELVASAVHRISLLAENRSVQIVQNVPEKLVIALDRQLIQRVLVNLFVNSLDAMPRGGIIRVSASPESGFIIVKVRDTGPGISGDLQDCLFQPFVSAGKVGGLGLGLALSRQALVAHGGEIWSESSTGGACFVIRLPMEPRRSASSC